MILDLLDDGQCVICGYYNCVPCEKCGNIYHTRGGYPFCPHGLSSQKSGFAEIDDDISFPTDMKFRSAAEIDRAAKAHNLDVVRVPGAKRWA